MGEYLKVNSKTIKVGTCEDLFYARLSDLQEIEALSISEQLEGNDSVQGYLDPKNGYRYRFPFPEEDGLGAGSYEKYDKGFAVTIDSHSAPQLYEFLRGKEWEHNTLCHSASVNGGYNVNLIIPCPLSIDFPKNIRMSCNGPSNVIEIIQQKQVEGQLWTVIRCGYCKAAIRLAPEAAAELANVLNLDADNFDRSYNHDHSNAVYYREIAARIMDGYN
jgi:hypothetical protein